MYDLEHPLRLGEILVPSITRRHLDIRQWLRLWWTAVVVGRAIPRNRGEPPAKRLGLPQLSQFPKRREEYLLHQVLHFRQRQARKQDPMHHANVAGVKLLERSLLSRLRCAHQCLLRSAANDGRRGRVHFHLTDQDDAGW